MCMLGEGWEAVNNNRSKIQRLKGGEEGEWDVNEIMGGRGKVVKWNWFIPRRARFDKEIEELILGYTVKAEGGGDVEMGDLEKEGLLRRRNGEDEDEDEEERGDENQEENKI
ncbi:hypothetical protein TrVE_jg3768 [Triparma verrucosa]|uniref:Uncharacterized protein n=1 Tax=Triparma verrucosa TaxID=1606542 RepID=A0A9W7FLB8_9STRA|nr:hypothetical protein TrVE_jg3768 [Triparma verrucosa]